MRFFFDNNVSIHLARGMREFGEDVEHLKDHFPQDNQYRPPEFSVRSPCGGGLLARRAG